MLQSSLRLGTVAGIRIGVHYTWFIIFFLISFSLYTFFRQQHDDWSANLALATAVITSLLFFASIILHELGHSIVAIARGIRVASITLFIFGGVAQTEKDSDSAATEFWVAIAGPLVSFFLAGMFYVLGILFGSYSEAVAESLAWLASINLMVAIFNLIPGFPLDGGRVFRAVIWGLSGNATKGMNWAVISGRVVAYALMALGLVVVLQTGMLLNGVWLAAIGWFLLAAAEASGQKFLLDRVFDRVLARQVMERDVPMIAASLSMTDWIDHYVLTSGQRAFLVEDGQRVTGLVTLSDISKMTREQWPTTPVRDVMTPVEKLHVVTPADSITEVFKFMRAHSLNQVPVVDGGTIIGWIDRDRLLKILRLHTETGR